MADTLPLDELIERLRERAADPERRTTVRPSELVATVRSLDLGGLLGMLGGTARQLGSVVAANRDGRIDPQGHAAATAVERSMRTPVPSVLPAPADDARLAAAEARLGVRLPAALRRVYGDVADGGFGPGEGLLPLDRVAAEYDALRRGDTLPRGRTWPAGLLPVVATDPGWDCVEASTGRVLAFDPEELDERVSDARWARAFRDLHASVEAWLSDWVGSRTQAEAMADQRQAMLASGAYTHIRTLQAMPPERLTEMGLEPGWEARMAANMGVPWPPPDAGAGPESRSG